MGKSRPPLERFAEKYLIDPNTECWNWSSTLSRSGYGKMWLGRGQAAAHRVAWILLRGPIPNGLWVLHHCDNRRCVNPEHLYLGTRLDNARDAVARHRTPTGDRNGMRTHPQSVIRGEGHHWHLRPETRTRGEAHHSAKLDPGLVREIRQLAASGVGIMELARRYGVRKYSIQKVVARQSWRHIA